MIDPLLQRQRERGPAPAHARVPRARRKGRSVRRRVVARRLALIIGMVLIPIAYSYSSGLTGPGSDSLQARTVEWARDHGLGTVVDRIERYWYAHHQAPLGGAPGAADQAQVAGTATTVNRPLSRSGGRPAPSPATPAVAAASAAQAPAPLSTPAGNPVAGEGVWVPFGPALHGRQGVYITEIRPDSVHTSSLDAVVRFDPTVVSFRQYPGSTIPGSPWDRPDHVEAATQAQLLAAFAGGFRLKDSNGGLILGGRVLKSMRTGAATFAIDTNGMPSIGVWGRDIAASASLDSARQNLDLIVDNGAPMPNLATDPNRDWGFTGPANSSAVWRSGAGVTADGALVWVGGPGLSIVTLADTLVRAGAVRGMQLDINHDWVQLNTYVTGADGSTTGKRILRSMKHSGDRWLTEDTRDFIAVFGRPA